jgi:hypothetical protein
LCGYRTSLPGEAIESHLRLKRILRCGLGDAEATISSSSRNGRQQNRCHSDAPFDDP